MALRFKKLIGALRKRMRGLLKIVSRIRSGDAQKAFEINNERDEMKRQGMENLTKDINFFKSL